MKCRKTMTAEIQVVNDSTEIEQKPNVLSAGPYGQDGIMVTLKSDDHGTLNRLLTQTRAMGYYVDDINMSTGQLIIEEDE